MKEQQVATKRKLRFPLWLKTLVVLLLSVTLVSVVAIIFSANALRRESRNFYTNKSTELASSLSLYVDKNDVVTVRDAVLSIYNSLSEEDKVENSRWGEPEWETYHTHYQAIEAMPEYTRLLAQLDSFDARVEAKYTYLAYADTTNKRLIYLVDNSVEDERCFPGSFDAFTQKDMSIITNPEQGFRPEITNMPEYGYLVSAGQPIYGSSNTIIGYALVDLSMNKIITQEDESVHTMIWILIALSVSATIVGYLLVLFLIVRPIRKLTKVANEYTKESHEGFNKFAEMKINTKDEIEDLTNAMQKMEGDINHYISDLLSTTAQLHGAEKEVDEMKNLANEDALTGVYNKRAYFELEERLNAAIKAKKAKFAVFMIDLNDLKVTNDTLGHEKGDDLIVSVSNSIKQAFSSSPIYRIGGDEFVVIIEGNNIKNLKKLQDNFVSEDKNNAAIGCAIFNSDLDNNVEDTFKRAEEMMYKNKKDIKENR